MNPNEPISPEFIAAGKEYLHLKAIHGAQSAQASMAFHHMLNVAPASFTKLLMDKAIEMGLIPKKPDAYSSDGTPLYRLEDIAERAGADVQEARQAVAAMGVQPAASDDIHLTH